MEGTGMQREQQEGPVAKQIEKQTSKLPSDLFLWTAMACLATSCGFAFAGRRETGLVIGQFAPVFLLLGIYNKIVKTSGSDVYQRQLH